MATDGDVPELPKGTKGGRMSRAGLNAASGAIPLLGGLLSAAAGFWSEKEQDRVNEFLRHWMEMLQAEMKEKAQTIGEILTRIDLSDEKTAERVESPEYQALLRKSFREWAGAESEEKRKLIRNLLVNAASISLCNDDIIRLFLEWLKRYSELHFAVVSKIYNNSGVTRREIWESLGKAPVREDSAEADLFKLLIRDLSTGGIIRQHRDTDGAGNFIRRASSRPTPKMAPARIAKSAFDDGESYELTALGNQFVHYTMSEITQKIAYNFRGDDNDE